MNEVKCQIHMSKTKKPRDETRKALIFLLPS